MFILDFLLIILIWKRSFIKWGDTVPLHTARAKLSRMSTPSQQQWPLDEKACVLHEMHLFEKCCSGCYTWVMLCFCASRFAPWRRRQAFYRIPFTSSMPSVGLRQAQWFMGWAARPPFCDFASWTACGDLFCHLQTQDDFQSYSLHSRKTREDWAQGEIRGIGEKGNCVIS